VFPVHPHDGLQQSQKRVVKPAVPVVGGVHATVLVLLLLVLVVDVVDVVRLVFDDVDDAGEFVDPDDGVVLDRPVPVDAVDPDPDVVAGRLPVVVEDGLDSEVCEPPFESSEPAGSPPACPHATTIIEPNVSTAKLALFIDRTPSYVSEARRTDPAARTARP
jgi:hypothetical protein